MEGAYGVVTRKSSSSESLRFAAWRIDLHDGGMPQIKTFKGLNNTSDSLALGLEWLVQADNVNITDKGKLKKREGYTLKQSGSFTGAYTTLDYQRMYLVDGGSLRTYDGTVLKTGISSAPMYWTEINDQVFFNNGTERGIILPDNTVIEWDWPVPTAMAASVGTGSLPAGMYQACCTYTLPDGRMTGAGDVCELTLVEGQSLVLSNIPHVAGYKTNVFIAPANSDVFSLAWGGLTASTAQVWNASPDDLGFDLMTAVIDPLPRGADIVQEWMGRMYAAQYFPSEDYTAVWFSQPLGFHLFDLAKDLLMVPGHVLMLAPTDTALIVGTESRIYAYADNKLTQLAPYGVVPGQHWSKDDAATLFWSVRGVCSALPFTNLTEQSVSVAPGVRAGGCLVRAGGQKRYLSVLQQGGSPFNAH